MITKEEFLEYVQMEENLYINEDGTREYDCNAIGVCGRDRCPVWNECQLYDSSKSAHEFMTYLIEKQNKLNAIMEL